jgi:hypothetical protein
LKKGGLNRLIGFAICIEGREPLTLRYLPVFAFCFAGSGAQA